MNKLTLLLTGVFLLCLIPVCTRVPALISLSFMYLYVMYTKMALLSEKRICKKLHLPLGTLLPPMPHCCIRRAIASVSMIPSSTVRFLFRTGRCSVEVQYGNDAYIFTPAQFVAGILSWVDLVTSLAITGTGGSRATAVRVFKFNCLGENLGICVPITVVESAAKKAYNCHPLYTPIVLDHIDKYGYNAGHVMAFGKKTAVIFEINDICDLKSRFIEAIRGNETTYVMVPSVTTEQEDE